MLDIIQGDLLNATEKYIAHNCNCLTENSAGTAKAIFDKYPHANTYARRVRDENGVTTNIDTPGLITILGDGKDERYVINMYAQYYPGRPKYPLSSLDGTATREKYFHKCLLRIAKLPNLESIAFPWRIGCNLGGGIWEHYLGTLTNFAHYVESTQGAKVFVYRRGGDE